MRFRLILANLILSMAVPSAWAGYGVTWRFDGNSGVASNGSPWNNLVAPAGVQVALLRATGGIEQSFAVVEPGAYTISFKSALRWWPEATHDYDLVVDGKALARIGPGQLVSGQWRPVTFTVDLAAGPHVLRFQGVNSAGGDHTSFIDDVRVAKGATIAPLGNPSFEDVPLPAGAFILNPPATTKPLYRFEGRITTSGKAVYGRIVRIADGIYQRLGAIATPPVLKVNGRTVATLDPSRLVDTGDHEGFLVLLPAGVKVRHDDTATITAPQAWATVPGDFARAMTDQPMEVCTDRSYTGTRVDGSNTLRVGTQIGHGGVPWWGTYTCFKNLLTRIQRWEGGVDGADGNWYPTSMNKDSADAKFIQPLSGNGLDSTGVPVPEGLYAVGWGATTASTTCSVVSPDADVTERTDLANPGDSGGNGKVRVFDVKRKPGVAAVNFTLYLRLTDPGRAPRFSYLVCYGPRDFTPIAPVVLVDVRNNGSISAELSERLAGGVGSFRFSDSLIGTVSSICEPEHMQPESRFAWYGWMTNFTTRFVQARPWTPATSPYVYSPLFGEPFAATLGTAMAASTPGAKHIIQIPDAATAPVIEGLVLTIGTERLRVLSVAGTAVTVKRGSESTPATAHAPGPIAVSGRLAMADLNSWIREDTQITELVSDGPHHFRSGQNPGMSGGPWPYLFYTDGSKMALTYAGPAAFVTGADTVVFCYGSAATHANVTMSDPIALDPTKHYAEMHLPQNSNIPYSVSARLASAGGGDLHVAIPFAASDSFVDAAAVQCRDNFPTGRRVYVEYINEPWNWGYPTSHNQYQLGWMLNRATAGQLFWQVRRTGQIAKRFADRFAEKGRGGEVRSILNMQQGSAGMVRGIIKQSIDEGLPVPDPAIAPYTSAPASLAGAFAMADPEQAVDLWIYNVIYGRVAGRSGPQSWLAQHRSAVDAANAEFGTHAELYGYEAGVENPWPEGEGSTAKARDLVYHPLFRIAEFDQYVQWQKYFSRVNISLLSLDYVNGNKLWGMYHYLGQRPSRGDGRDGLFDHSLFLATPGSPNSKAPIENQDIRRGSVRGQSLIDWNRWTVRR